MQLVIALLFTHLALPFHGRISVLQPNAGDVWETAVSPWLRGDGTYGGRRYPPCAFTEQGVAMLSSVLRSARAVQVNIAIMRTFVRLRQMLASHRNLAHKVEELEKKYDKQFQVVFEAIRQRMVLPEGAARRIGFQADKEGK